MRTTRWVPLVLFALPFAALTAQAPPPPPAELATLAQWVGNWKYEGDYKASPMGPASKVSGTETGKMILNGWFFEWTGQEKSTFGNVEWREIDAYDPVKKTYPFSGEQNDGSAWSGHNAVTGKVWKMTGMFMNKGVTYWMRSEGTFSADNKVFTSATELSTDAKAWKPWSTVKTTKLP